MKMVALLAMLLASAGCVPLVAGAAAGYAVSSPTSPQVVVVNNSGQAAPAPAKSHPVANKCEAGWWTTPQGYCCPLGYDDAGNGTCNPSKTLVETAAR
jgi:hypothetical protein